MSHEIEIKTISKIIAEAKKLKDITNILLSTLLKSTVEYQKNNIHNLSEEESELYNEGVLEGIKLSRNFIQMYLESVIEYAESNDNET